MSDQPTRRGQDRRSRARDRLAVEDNCAVRMGRVPVAKCRIHRCNERDHGDLRALMASIENEGVEQPITVQQHQGWFEVVDGARRFLALQLLGRRTVVAYIRPARADDEVLIAMVATDVHKKRLTPAERGRVVKQLQEEGWTVGDMAIHWGVAESTVYGWIHQANLGNGHGDDVDLQPQAEPDQAADPAAVSRPAAGTTPLPAHRPAQARRNQSRRGAPKWKTHLTEMCHRWQPHARQGLTPAQTAELLTELARLAGAGLPVRELEEATV